MSIIAIPTFTVSPVAPGISSLDVSTGPEVGGTAVVITGTNFTGATGVTFGGAAGTNFSVVSPTSITVTTPAGTGAVDVVVQHPLGTGTLVAGFVYQAPGGDNEPIYNSGIHTSIFYEDFQSYANTAAMFSDYGTRGVNYKSGPSYVPGLEQFAVLSLNPTAGVSGGKCLEVEWHPRTCQVGVDADGWLNSSGRHSGTIPVRGYGCAQFYFKTEAGFDPSCGSGAMKTSIFDQGVSNQRIVFDYSSGGIESAGYAGETEGLVWCAPYVNWESKYCGGYNHPSFSHYGPSPAGGTLRYTATPAGRSISGTVTQEGSRGPDSYVNNGNWHRYTILWRRESSTNAGDGTCQVWCDGVLVVDYQGENPANVAYGKTYTSAISHLMTFVQFPTTLNGASPGGRNWSVYYDQYRIFYWT